MGKRKYKSKRTSSWLGVLESSSPSTGVWVPPFPSQGTLSGDITTFSHIFRKSCKPHLGTSNTDAGGGSQGQRVLQVSWFPPPSCWKNDRSHGGILTLLGSGFHTNKRQLGRKHTDKFPWGTAEDWLDDLGRSFNSQNG